MRNIFIVVLGYITGIIIGLYCKIGIAFFYLLFFSIYILIKKYVYINRNLKRYIKLINKKVIVIFAVSSIIANIIVIHKNNLYENKYKNIEKAKFKAVVISEAKEKEYYNQYKIKIETMNKDKSYKGTILLLNLNKDVRLKYGEEILFWGEYKAPEIQRNYKGFSYQEYLKSIDIYGTLKASYVEKIGEKRISCITKLSNYLRNEIKARIKDNIQNEDKSNLLLGVLLGYDDELPGEIREDFSNSGLSHILAVSGMHVSYVVMGITFLLSKFRCSKKSSNFITIILLIFFIFLTGETPSVKRACIMTILSLGASIVNRKSDVINNISIALLIILVKNPFALLDTGLILSFLACIGIISCNSIVRKVENSEEKQTILEIIKNKMKEIIKISISVQIFILPISILFFNKITLTFIFSNLFICFIISIILVLGYIYIIIPITPIKLILDQLLGLLLIIANFFANIPISKIIISTPSILFIISYYILVMIYIYIKILKNKQVKRRIEKNVLTIVDRFKYNIFKNLKVIFIIYIVGIILVNFINTNKIHIYFIDVGQGDGTLIVTPHNKTILVDGGGNKNTEQFDVGKQTLLPYLLDRRVTQIDYLIISHFDTDHSRFCAYYFRKFRCKTNNYWKTI